MTTSALCEVVSMIQIYRPLVGHKFSITDCTFVLNYGSRNRSSSLYLDRTLSDLLC